MLRKGKVTEKIYCFLKENRYKPFKSMDLAMWIVYLKTKERNIAFDTEKWFEEARALCPTVRRNLARMARKGLIIRAKRGSYAYAPPLKIEYIDQAKMLQLVDKFYKLSQRVLGHTIPDTPENRRILYEKLQDTLSSLEFRRN